MTNDPSPRIEPAASVASALQLRRSIFALPFAAMLFAVLTAVFLPKGYAMTACGDLLQFALLAATAVLAFLNFLQSQARVRVFWFLTFLGVLIWTTCAAVWAYYELLRHRPIPTTPFVDMMLFVLIVPLAMAFAAAPHRQGSSSFLTFGLLDVSVLMVYVLYLYGLVVFSYVLIPDAISEYNFRFDVADAIGNQILVIGSAVALLSSQGRWKTFYRLYFFSAVGLALASSIMNTAIDSGNYCSGDIHDIPFAVSLAGLLAVALAGRSLLNPQPSITPVGEASELPGKGIFLSSHFAMLVVLSTPLTGIWLLSGTTAAPLLRFRLIITLVTVLVLALLLSIKQDLLTSGLVTSLARLSEMYTSIERFKSRLSQSEKLASLGESVAEVANQIKQCMTAILNRTAQLSSRPVADARVQGMASKIRQYAQRTDALVDNMLHFAQETPIRLTTFEIKPLLESALQLSRAAKMPDIQVKLTQEGQCPPVCADSGQMLHVFLELISNAVDALQEINGGSLEINISHVDSQVRVQFLDSGPGVTDPARVFEPFYTTKVVGKGTGLGLSTCYGILRQHQGDIICRNRLTGGASFTISLPVSAQLPTESASSPVVAEGVS
jgi:signal transduction histidine kinase